VKPVVRYEYMLARKKGTKMSENNLEIDLEGLEFEDIEVFFEEGGLGMPVFAASTAGSGANCSAPNSCSSGKGG